MSYSFCAPPLCQRKPVIISSRINSAPLAWHSALQRVQVAGRRVLGARRLEDQRGDAPGVLLEQRRGAGEIVVAEGRGQLADDLRDAGVHRRGADEPVVGREERVVGAAGDHVAPGIGAGEAHRARGRVGAVLAELDHLGAVDQRQEALRARHLERRGAGEVAAAHQLALRRIDHRGIGVAEPDRAVAHAVLDVLVAVGVPHPAAEPARDEAGRQDRVLVVALGVGVAAARDQVMGHFPQARRYPMAVQAHCTLRTSRCRASRPSLHGS